MSTTHEFTGITAMPGATGCAALPLAPSPQERPSQTTSGPASVRIAFASPAGAAWAGADEPLPRRAWRRLAQVPVLRSPLTTLLFLGAVAALLYGFSYVVQAGVRQAAQRHAESRAQANEYWRCRLAKGEAARAACLTAPQQSTHIATR